MYTYTTILHIMITTVSFVFFTIAFILIKREIFVLLLFKLLLFHFFFSSVVIIVSLEVKKIFETHTDLTYIHSLFMLLTYVEHDIQDSDS